MKKLIGFIIFILFLGTVPSTSLAAGMLTPTGSGHQPIRIRDHHVNVVINNGFAMTEVLQTFYNPNQQDLEAVYSFPLPKSASLSEVTIYVGEREINGEVLEKKKHSSSTKTKKAAAMRPAWLKKMNFTPLISGSTRCRPTTKPKFGFFITNR